jgi:hypothetical protein
LATLRVAVEMVSAFIFIFARFALNMRWWMG